MTVESAPSRKIRRAMLVVPVAFSLAACPNSRFTPPFLSAMPQGGPPTAGSISFTATCPPGSTRLGGGFMVAPENDNHGLVVRGSYPSDANGWTLEVENTTPMPQDSSALMVIAYCAQRADLNLNATVVPVGVAAPLGGGLASGAAKTIISAPCTAPAVLTGGGYYADGPLNANDASFNAGVLESAPDGSAWHVEVGEALATVRTRLYKAYAVCTTGLPAGTMSEISTMPVAGQMTVTAAPCTDPNTYVTAGGFRLNGKGHNNPDPALTVTQGRAYESAMEHEFAQWRIDTNTLAAGTPVTAVVLCARIP